MRVMFDIAVCHCNRVLTRALGKSCWSQADLGSQAAMVMLNGMNTSFGCCFCFMFAVHTSSWLRLSYIQALQGAAVL